MAEVTGKSDRTRKWGKVRIGDNRPRLQRFRFCSYQNAGRQVAIPQEIATLHDADDVNK
jgi:hypothetical protein